MQAYLAPPLLQLSAERIYWDQATVLQQVGLLPADVALPITGVEQVRRRGHCVGAQWRGMLHTPPLTRPLPFNPRLQATKLECISAGKQGGPPSNALIEEAAARG